MKRKMLFSLCLAFVSLGAWAQGPNGSGTYYQNADGKSGAALKTALHNIISKKAKSPGYDELLELYKKTDTRPDGKVRDWYSNITNFVHIKDKAGNYSKEGDVYNREHLVPQSWGAPKSDIMHVVPTDGYVNNRRSNLPFGEVGTVKYQSANGYSKMGTCKTAGYSGNVFEPNDSVKGDIARIYFYMTTCYEGTCHKWGNGVFTGTEYQPLATWAYDMLVRWSKLDPVDEVERARNDSIALKDVQGNRNPFVDYPGLEDYIWGEKKDFAFSYDNYAQGDSIIDKRVAQPQFSPEGGTFQDSVVVTITCTTDSATIYYTTNGTEASTNSHVYDGPVILRSTATLKAIAVRQGMSTSYQTLATYVIKKSNPSGDTTDEEVTIALNNAFFGSTASGSLSGNDKRDYTATKDGIAVTYGAGTGSSMYMNDSQIRLYAGNALTVSTTDGSDLVWAEFTLVLNNNGKTMQASTGSISDLTWMGCSPSVTFSVNSGSGHMRLSQLKVRRAAITPEPPKKGDVNGDGIIDVADISAIISTMAGASSNLPQPGEASAADVNGDGTIDVADISSVISIMAGK